MQPERASGLARGFTLIEVLAALVIVSLGMLGVIQAVGQTASNSVYLRDKTLAHWIAMNKLTEVRLSASPPSIDKSSDEIDYAGRRWRWTMDVQETPVASMRRIDVRVSLDGEDSDRSALALLTGFYGEAIAAPGTTFVSWDPVTPGQQGDGASAGGTQDPATTGGTPSPADGNTSAMPRPAP
jgi:general secretion pathway protein I